MYFLFVAEMENGMQKLVSMMTEKQRKKTSGKTHTQVQCSAGT